MTSRAPQWFFRIGRWTDRIERWTLTLLLGGMVILAGLQIALRNLWQTGLNWIDPLLGMALLWLTMLGGLAATGKGRHLAINFTAALLPKHWAAAIARITALFGAIICVLLATASGHYIGIQREMDLSQLLGWPLWKYYLVVPVLFWVMALRLFLRSLLPTSWHRESEETENSPAKDSPPP